MSEIWTFGFGTFPLLFGCQTVPIADTSDNWTKLCLVVQTERLKYKQNWFQTSLEQVWNWLQAGFVRLSDVWDEPNHFKPNKILFVLSNRTFRFRTLIVLEFQDIKLFKSLFDIISGWRTRSRVWQLSRLWSELPALHWRSTSDRFWQIRCQFLQDFSGKNKDRLNCHHWLCSIFW